ncbi:hypothetical protein LOAG_01094 [Loa loa]|uniref:Uncharacterized protein n=1 Tax=Loa loa TaxID=7209 RepID=A0A1S0U9N3_LOALO|nr:hypothetical protein LOAG_01094 [Loa loa]EFO27383.1 hypothetical protein LOAG_01094 [Loa loa]
MTQTFEGYSFHSTSDGILEMDLIQQRLILQFRKEKKKKPMRDCNHPMFIMEVNIIYTVHEVCFVPIRSVTPVAIRRISEMCRTQRSISMMPRRRTRSIIMKPRKWMSVEMHDGNYDGSDFDNWWLRYMLLVELGMYFLTVCIMKESAAMLRIIIGGS